jgi:hypothetical protein
LTSSGPPAPDRRRSWTKAQRRQGWRQAHAEALARTKLGVALLRVSAGTPLQRLAAAAQHRLQQEGQLVLSGIGGPACLQMLRVLAGLQQQLQQLQQRQQQPGAGEAPGSICFSVAYQRSSRQSCVDGGMMVNLHVRWRQLAPSGPAGGSSIDGGTATLSSRRVLATAVAVEAAPAAEQLLQAGSSSSSSSQHWLAARPGGVLAAHQAGLSLQQQQLQEQQQHRLRHPDAVAAGTASAASWLDADADHMPPAAGSTGGGPLISPAGHDFVSLSADICAALQPRQQQQLQAQPQSQRRRRRAGAAGSVSDNTAAVSLLVQRLADVELVLEAIALANRKLQQRSKALQIVALPSWQQHTAQGVAKQVIRLELRCCEQ